MTIAAEQMPDRGCREMPVHAQASLVRDAGDRPSGVSFSGGFRTDTPGKPAGSRACVNRAG